MLTKIRKARLSVGLKLHDVALPLGMTIMKLSLMERELNPLPPELERKILFVIQRLSRLNEAVARKRKAFVADVSATA